MVAAAAFIVGIVVAFAVLGWKKAAQEDWIDEYEQDFMTDFSYLHTSTQDSVLRPSPENRKLRLVQGYGGKPEGVQKTSVAERRGNLDPSDTPWSR